MAEAGLNPASAINPVLPLASRSLASQGERAPLPEGVTKKRYSIDEKFVIQFDCIAYNKKNVSLALSSIRSTITIVSKGMEALCISE